MHSKWRPLSPWGQTSETEKVTPKLLLLQNREAHSFWVFNFRNSTDKSAKIRIRGERELLSHLFEKRTCNQGLR